MSHIAPLWSLDFEGTARSQSKREGSDRHEGWTSSRASGANSWPRSQRGVQRAASMSEAMVRRGRA